MLTNQMLKRRNYSGSIAAFSKFPTLRRRVAAADFRRKIAGRADHAVTLALEAGRRGAALTHDCLIWRAGRAINLRPLAADSRSSRASSRARVATVAKRAPFASLMAWISFRISSFITRLSLFRPGCRSRVVHSRRFRIAIVAGADCPGSPGAENFKSTDRAPHEPRKTRDAWRHPWLWRRYNPAAQTAPPIE